MHYVAKVPLKYCQKIWSRGWSFKPGKPGISEAHFKTLIGFLRRTVVNTRLCLSFEERTAGWTLSWGKGGKCAAGGVPSLPVTFACDLSCPIMTQGAPPTAPLCDPSLFSTRRARWAWGLFLEWPGGVSGWGVKGGTCQDPDGEMPWFCNQTAHSNHCLTFSTSQLSWNYIKILSSFSKRIILWGHITRKTMNIKYKKPHETYKLAPPI